MTSVSSQTGAAGAAGEFGHVEELAELISRSARKLRRGAVGGLSPLGLTYGQARLLRLVEEAGQPLRMADIAARLEVVPRAVTSMVDGVEEAGLVSRRPDPADRRSVLVELSPAGRRLLRHVAAARAESARQVLGVLDETQRAQLLGLLRTLCPATEPAGPQGD